MQCPCLVHEATAPSAARYARKASSRAAPPPERQRAQWRSRVPRKSRLIMGGRSWHFAPEPRAEGERPLTGAVPFYSAWNGRNQRGTARARSKLACCASSRETASAMARPRVPRKPADYGWPPLARRTTAARRRRETLRRCSAFSSCMKRPQPAWYGVRAGQA